MPARAALASSVPRSRLLRPKKLIRRRDHHGHRKVNLLDESLSPPKWKEEHNISSGMKLWGVITEVNLKDLVISLPGELRGFVHAEDASDMLADNEDKVPSILPKTFNVGKLVACRVMEVGDDKVEEKGRKRIRLSLRLSVLYKGLTLDAVHDGMVLVAQVTSVEDHGFTLHFGVPSFSGFLPRMDDGGIPICRGQLLQCVVKSIDKARAIVYTSSSTDLVSKYAGLSIDLLVPGMLVNARVVSMLKNRIKLSFLTHFTGTVDVFHLQNSHPTDNWRDDYPQNKKVLARILSVDPSTKTIGLTLNLHLVQHRPPPMHVKTGEIYEKCTILRIDENVGLLLSIPSSPEHTPAYVHRFDVSDEEVGKLQKKFKEGDYACLRVLRIRHLEGLAIGTLKASALERPIFTHSDVKPGMLLRAQVIVVEPFGAIVQLACGVKALCPCRHMSELERVKPSKKFKVGAEFLFRVLGCKSKRITVTHKKTLVKSKLAILASHADATEGLVTHGWITKIENHGCYLKFYNGILGFAPRSELGLDPGSEPNAVYHVEQVVKCRIISPVSASRIIHVSFVVSPKRISDADMVRLGSIVGGVVDKLTPTVVIIGVKSYKHFKGLITYEHLADHQGQVASLRSLLRPGFAFDQLVVLDIDGSNLILSAKYSLVHFVEDIPSDITHMHPLSVVHGYINNIIETGCFVRFLGRLTGFSAKIRATANGVGSLLDAFYIGQSVRSHVVSVDNGTGKIKLAMKQSLCFSTDASFIKSYFLVEDMISELQSVDGIVSDSNWAKDFSIGSVHMGKVQEIKESGVVLGFEKSGGIVGFVSQHQLGGVNVEKGSVVKAFVLDISKTDNLVDLSLKPELIDGAKMNGSRKKRHRTSVLDLELHQTVNATVEIVKENYLVLSLPEHDYAVGYASAIDYNTQKIPYKHFSNGQRMLATVEALPSADSSGRLLLLLKALSEVYDSSVSKRAKKMFNYIVGSLVDAEIIDIKSLELLVKFGAGFHGKIHITEVNDADHFLENPFSNFCLGQLVKARIIAKVPQTGKNKNSFKWLLSIKPSILTGNMEARKASVKIDDISVGSIVKGYVMKVDKEWVQVSITRHLVAHLFILDSSSEPHELQEFHKRFSVGQVVTGRAISVNKEKKRVRLSLHSLFERKTPLVSEAEKNDNDDSSSSNNTEMEHILTGYVIGGRIKKIFPNVGGMFVQIGPHLFGKVHYTEIADSWIADPSSGYEEGQFVKCRVLEISRSSTGFAHVDLSLRASLIDPSELSKEKDPSSKRFEKIEDLYPNMEVHGYVKHVTSRGCFIMLSRKLDARIFLSNLSDGFVENPDKEFPAGKIVHGRVLTVEFSSKRVDVTLKKNVDSQLPKPDSCSFSSIHVGVIISGHIRRVETYGLFIAIDGTNLVGLCHISELSDDHTVHIETKYRAGERVEAKILKIDEERQRIALGMKKSYVDEAKNAEVTVLSAAMDCTLPAWKQDLSCIKDITDHQNDGATDIFLQAESRASVLPLQVSLDESENTHVESVLIANQDNVNEATEIEKRKNRHLKKKEKQNRELEIRLSEERRLQNDMPETVDDYEKLVRSSPNSSFYWIKYMEFMLAQADVQKARSVAERALKTIIFQEEVERLNIWVAYFNLENAYGNSPEENVERVFKKALQTCDPKKLHLALLGLYERTEQHNLADVLLDKMTKKFKKSCKVWLCRVQQFVKLRKDGLQFVINRALLSLPMKKHIKFISHAAILEFKYGEPEMGRSMFEGILREHPKRTDIWSIYLDQEIRVGDNEVIRALFERATCLSLPAKKMKFLFKKYHSYEESQGDQDRVEQVKKKALQFLESSY
ncbi:rRNA biogenesis protein RRP5 isoform X2 [Phalaenopsis equestris]|uniref:rRNA biogenesis protein RRP5 isoform X2 n=1 Tax=Phalaenopsis equestris TaxID=78828 RepID=UPI0009E36290|nr:rRNA biogenesis protein RRP5 isoform X2 [Phalaenopsis equestris]